MQKRITLKDIARQTGYHVSTVSRALDANSRIALTEDVVKSIRAAAEVMGYRRNRVASGLRTNRTMTVGVIIPDITNTLFPPMVRGIESVLEPEGYASIIVNTDNLPEREGRLIDVLTERGVDGILHAAPMRDDSSIRALRRQGIPVVTLNRRVDGPQVPYVVSDDALGVRLMLEHLVALGHRRIGYIAGPQTLSTGAQRLVAFVTMRDALGLAEADCPVALAARFDDLEGARCAAELVARGGSSALMTANDRLALGAIAHLKSVGIAVPGELSVTGFNDVPLLELVEPRLTTIRIPKFSAGQAAARLLLEVIGGTTPDNLVLPVELVSRDSVAPPR